MKRFIKLMLASVIGSALTIGVFMLTGMNRTIESHVHKFPSAPAKYALYAVNEHGEAVPLDFTGVSKKVMNAVVHIKTSKKVSSKNQGFFYSPDPFGDDFFKYFFGEPQSKNQPRQKEEPFMEMGAASGVIIDGNGYIVTNNHVIDGADEIEVSLYDNEVYKAKVIGTDPSTDLAIIQIKKSGLESLPFSNSDDVEVGQWVLAVGNPFDLNSTVTAGIVSAKGRNINIINDKSAIEAFIQTDAAINPGNSGGALVNLNGELIGINTAIASPTGAYSGYGFAIPSNIVSKVVKDIMKYGMVQRAYLGVLIHSVDGDFANEKKLDISEGAYVDSIMDKSAAGEAGIRQGDIIIGIDSVKIKKSADLLEQIGRRHPGDKVNVMVNRNGKKLNYEVVLANQKGSRKVETKENQDVLDILGASFETVDKTTAKKIGIDGGVRVKKLYSGLLQSQTSIDEGFIITHVNNKEVKSVEELKDDLKDYKGGVILGGIYENYPGEVYYAFGLN
jgi:Do/DeqQ family serine protease